MTTSSPKTASSQTASSTTASSTTSRPSLSRRAARAVRVAVVVASGVAAVAATATTASAATTSGTDLTAATSYGFECDAQWGWVRQSWPNVSVRSAASTEVRVHALLYRWEGGSWQLVQTGDSYTGISTVSGRQSLGPDLAGQPYYFALSGRPSTLPPERGPVFDHLSPGWYTSVEEYSALGRTWRSSDGQSSVDYCRI